MRESLAAICEQFIQNRNIIKGAFGWESSYMYPVCAAIFTDKRQNVDVEKLQHCRDLLKEKTGIFSNFRGNAKLAVISMLAVSGNPEGKLDKSLQVFGMLKEHFFTSEYLPVASMMIADMAKESQYKEIAARTRHMYDLMKKEHPILTSGEDSVFAALLALSGFSDEYVGEETEKCYKILKAQFFSGNAVQSLTHVLTLGEGDADEKCRRVMELYRSLKEKGYKYGTDYELATLGVLALLPEDLNAVMEDIMAVDDFLAEQKGYGLLGLGRKQRLMHAGMLVANEFISESNSAVMKSAAIGGTVSLIAAQQAAICAAIAASSIAASTSASS